MIRFIKNYIVYIVIILVVAVLIGASIFMMKGIDGARKYDCDVHIISLNTNISVKKDGQDYSKIDGNIFRIVEDPLTMTIDEQKVAYAGDAYHFINQDSHTIYLNNEFAVEMTGELSVFGNDYNTPDGTGVRDYIHVVDLAIGHVKALDKIKENVGCKIYNLGTGHGYSVLDIVKNFEEATGVKIPYQIKDRRAGDIATCYSDATKAKEELGWVAERGIKEMCEDSWRWQSNNPNGYND